MSESRLPIYRNATREELLAEVVRLENLVTRIQGALGTGEMGDNLVAVARDAHTAEQELAAIKRKEQE